MQSRNRDGYFFQYHCNGVGRCTFSARFFAWFLFFFFARRNNSLRKQLLLFFDRKCYNIYLVVFVSNFFFIIFSCSKKFSCNWCCYFCHHVYANFVVFFIREINCCCWKIYDDNLLLSIVWFNNLFLLFVNNFCVFSVWTKT